MPKLDLYTVGMQSIDQVENRLIEDGSGRKLVTDIIKAGVERVLSQATLFGTLRSGSTSTGDAGTGSFNNIAGGQVIYSRQLMPTEYDIDANDNVTIIDDKIKVNQLTLNINVQKMIKQEGNIVDFTQLGSPQGQSILNMVMTKQMQRVEDTLDRSFLQEMYNSTSFTDPDGNISAGTLSTLTAGLDAEDPSSLFDRFEGMISSLVETSTDEITGINPQELFAVMTWKALSKLRRAPMYQGAGSQIESEKFINGANQIGISPADVVLGVPIYVSERLPVEVAAGGKGKTIMLIGVNGCTALEYADYRTGMKDVPGRLTKQNYMTEYSFGTTNIFPDLVFAVNEVNTTARAARKAEAKKADAIVDTDKVIKQDIKVNKVIAKENR